jgi:hypothetical protein
VEQWLEHKSDHLTGNIVTRTQVLDPEKSVLLFDACEAINKGKAMWRYSLWLWRPVLGKFLYIR